MAGINQGVPETAIGEPIRLGSNNEFEIEQHPVSDRLIIRDTVNGKVAYVRKERGGQIGGDGVLIKALKEGKPMADDGRTYDTIQQAEREASSWVFVPPGTYNETVNISTDGLTLQGCGYNTYIHPPSGPAIEASYDSDIEQNATVKNLRTRSEDDFCILLNEFTNPNVLNVYASTDTANGSDVIRADGGTIVNCRVTESGRNSIATFDPRTTVSGCVISGTNGGDAINISSGNALVSNNVIRQVNSTGILIKSNSNIVVANRVIDAENDGIGIEESDCIVANNRVSDSTNADIDDNGTNTLLDGNLTGASN